VLSDLANAEGPALIDTLASTLSQLDIVIATNDEGAVPKREPSLGQSFLDTQRRLEPGFAAIAERLGLSKIQAAHAAAAASAYLIQQYSSELEAPVGFDIAVYSLVEGAKTVPRPHIRP
jgi:hypothetical protein